MDSAAVLSLLLISNTVKRAAYVADEPMMSDATARRVGATYRPTPYQPFRPSQLTAGPGAKLHPEPVTPYFLRSMAWPENMRDRSPAEPYVQGSRPTLPVKFRADTLSQYSPLEQSVILGTSQRGKTPDGKDYLRPHTPTVSELLHEATHAIDAEEETALSEQGLEALRALRRLDAMPGTERAKLYPSKGGAAWDGDAFLQDRGRYAKLVAQEMAASKPRSSGMTYEQEIPATVAETSHQLSSRQHEGTPAWQVGRQAEAGTGLNTPGWVYDHIRKYGPRTRSGPDLAANVESLRSWMRSLRGDTPLGRSYRQFLHKNVGGTPDVATYEKGIPTRRLGKALDLPKSIAQWLSRGISPTP